MWTKLIISSLFLDCRIARWTNELMKILCRTKLFQFCYRFGIPVSDSIKWWCLNNLNQSCYFKIITYSFYKDLFYEKKFLSVDTVILCISLLFHAKHCNFNVLLCNLLMEFFKSVCCAMRNWNKVFMLRYAMLFYEIWTKKPPHTESFLRKPITDLSEKYFWISYNEFKSF